jgi:hypothetical protein
MAGGHCSTLSLPIVPLPEGPTRLALGGLERTSGLDINIFQFTLWLDIQLTFRDVTPGRATAQVFLSAHSVEL